MLRRGRPSSCLLPVRRNRSKSKPDGSSRIAELSLSETLWQWTQTQTFCLGPSYAVPEGTALYNLYIFRGRELPPQTVREMTRRDWTVHRPHVLSAYTPQWQSNFLYLRQRGPGSSGSNAPPRDLNQTRLKQDISHSDLWLLCFYF